MSEPWSFSRLQLYTRCPAAWAFKYRDRLPEQTSPAAVRGQQVHEFVEAYSRHCFAAKVPTDYDEGRRLLASYSEEVQAVSEQFMQSTVFDWSLVVSVGGSIEREFEVALPDKLGTFRGRVDMVLWNEYDSGLVVVDYKSGFGPIEPPETCPPQLRCYAWAMSQEFPAADVVTAQYRYLGNNMTHDWQLYRPQPDWAASVIRRIQADRHFSPTPSTQACGFCGYTQHCSLYLADPILHPRDEDEACRTCEQAWAAQARVDALKGALKDFTSDREPLVYAGVPVAGKFAPKANGHKAQFKEGVTIFEFIATCASMGVDAAAFFSPKDDKLGALLHDDFSAWEDDPEPFGDENPELEAVRAMLEEKPSSGRLTFRLEKAPVAPSGEEDNPDEVPGDVC